MTEILRKQFVWTNGRFWAALVGGMITIGLATIGATWAISAQFNAIKDGQEKLQKDMEVYQRQVASLTGRIDSIEHNGTIYYRGVQAMTEARLLKLEAQWEAIQKTQVEILRTTTRLETLIEAKFPRTENFN